jgi:hypothetical protein
MFQFLVSPERKLQGPIELLNINGIKTAELIFPETKEQKPALAEFAIPFHALTGSPLRITGPFDGNSSNTNCTLNNKPMEILAESPGNVSFLYLMMRRSHTLYGNKQTAM